MTGLFFSFAPPPKNVTVTPPDAVKILGLSLGSDEAFGIQSEGTLTLAIDADTVALNLELSRRVMAGASDPVVTVYSGDAATRKISFLYCFHDVRYTSYLMNSATPGADLSEAWVQFASARYVLHRP